MQISQGAEAKIFLENNEITKDRFEKKYRHPLIDSELRKQRTRREAKILDNKNGLLKMSFIEGSLVKNILNKNNSKKISNEIGKKIAILHSKDIIHGDLTTSNMILKGNGIHFIDFGLGFFSEKIEDKAVDLHLIRQALESKHHQIWEQCFREVLEGYKNYNNHKEVFNRLKIVESR